MFAATCVSFVLINWYNPSENALGALCTVCMDVLCMIILIIFIVNYGLNRYEYKKSTTLFVELLLATLLALLLDFLNWAFDGSLGYDNNTVWFTIGSLCMGPVMAIFFIMYLYHYMEETHGLSNMKLSAYICAACNLISCVLTFILAVTGTAFSFVDGHYETGTLYDMVVIIPFLTLLYLVGYTIHYATRIGWHDVVGASGYILFMLAGASLESAYSIGTTYISVAIADVYIYVMLQNALIEKEKQKTLEWMEKSKLDGLTGLNNRYAYESDMVHLEKTQISDGFIYVSIDINSLKEVNDSLGHSAGDEILKGATECMKKCFGAYGSLYRTGGDEFVALIFVDPKQITAICSDFEKTINSWTGSNVKKLSVAYGYATKLENLELPIRQIAILADERMYQAKRAYHRKNANK